MNDEDKAGPGRATPGRTTGDAFQRAEATASRYGFPKFCAWRASLERRYTVMPLWYWNTNDCRRRYISHIRAAIDWQRRERNINRGNADFHRSLID